MQILEAEINLREETRVVEQARPALAEDVHRSRAKALSTTQEELRGRVEGAARRMAELPDGVASFGGEIALLNKVSSVMSEAVEILARPDTGPPAIGAESEVIELLLEAKRCNPKGGGGGGGSTPGGGGADDVAEQPAIALLGSGANLEARPGARDVHQASGQAGRALPEEFRAGLDEYFNRLERQ
jgi:hypothetical protein